MNLDRYDAGLLGAGGGGNVQWWQDYLRHELERAHEFYQSQVESQDSELNEANRLLGDSAFYIRRMARMLEGHPSRIQLRALDFVKKKLLCFERHIVPMKPSEKQ